MKQIAVFFGGSSSEYEVSLKSAHSVLTHIDRSRYTVHAVGITREGKWYLYEGSPERLLDDSWHTEASLPVMISPNRGEGLIVFRGDERENITLDAAFPVLHGKNGEDGTIQGLIELAGIALIGCDTMSSALCMDKYRAHVVAHQAGVLVPQGVIIRQSETEEQIAKAVQALQYPLFVKPLRAGSSFGITKVEQPQDLSQALQEGFGYDSEVIVEENIEGFEVGCGVIGTDELTISRVDEIELSQGFFDYEEKYTLKHSKIHMPARIDAQTEQRIQEVAQTIYKALGCKGFARVDMFLSKDGQVIFNEVNTIPGLTTGSRFPKMMQSLGLSFGKLMDTLIERALS